MLMINQKSIQNGKADRVGVIKNIVIHSFWGLLIPLLLTACDWPFREILKPSNTLLIYLLGVFFSALKFGLWSSMLASLSSAASFAYFYAPPIFSFEIYEKDNLLGLVVMLVIGSITSRLTATLRSQKKLAELREKRTNSLYHLGQNLQKISDAVELTTVGQSAINREFEVDSTLILIADINDLAVFEAQISQYPESNMISWVVEHQSPAGFGESAYSDHPALLLPMFGTIGCIGVCVLSPMKFQLLPVGEERQFLENYVGQIANTWERVYWTEQNKKASLKIQSENLRSSLLSSISHDLRTPLATIVGAATALENDEIRCNSDRCLSLVESISFEAQRMSDLMLKILDMARLESGEVKLNKQWFETEEVIGSALNRIDKTLSDRSIHINIPNGHALIHVDAVLMQTVLVNLLDNAMKYSSPPSPLTVDVDVRATEVIIKIMDRGIGISRGYEERIFDKFFQMHPEGTQNGVGLGLSICRAIIVAHEGHIDAYNRVDGGAEFRVVLPIKSQPPSMCTETDALEVG